MPDAKKFHVWAFRRLYDYTTYKTEAVQVNPAYTSKRCSKCGTTLDENRPSQAEFCCQKYGYEINDEGYQHEDNSYGAKVSAQRGDTSPRPEVEDAERE